MLVASPLVAQADPNLANPSTWEQFGPFGIVFVVLVGLGGGIIGWLLRERSRVEADHQAAISGLKAEHAAEMATLTAQRDDLFNQVVETGERVTSVVERSAPLLEANTQALTQVLERLRTAS